MKRSGAMLGVLLLMAAPVSNAAVSDEDFAVLQAQLRTALQRLEQLEQRQQQTTVTVAQLAESNVQTTDIVARLAESNEQTVAAVEQATVGNKSLSWPDRIRWAGDFRYRYQNDDVASVPGGDDRNRQRIRARPALVAEVTDTVEVGFGLATGSDEPVSSNQTLGNFGSSKDIVLDLAYFDWRFYEDARVTGGKFKNTLDTAGKSHLQWDEDWRPEGFDLSWNGEMFFASFLATWLQSDSNATGGDEFAYIVQTGAKGNIGDATWKAGVGYTEISSQGEVCFFAGISNVTCQGNEADPVTDTYLYDFEVYNVFADITFDVANLPLSIFGDYVKNDAANEFDSGYLLGAQLGTAMTQGTWQVKYYYEDLESNATLGLLTNSDFGGGGTNGKGSVLAAAYATTDMTTVKLTYYAVEKNSDNNPNINGGQTFDVDTLQIDFNFKYK